MSILNLVKESGHVTFRQQVASELFVFNYLLIFIHDTHISHPGARVHPVGWEHQLHQELSGILRNSSCKQGNPLQTQYLHRVSAVKNMHKKLSTKDLLVITACTEGSSRSWEKDATTRSTDQCATASAS